MTTELKRFEGVMALLLTPYLPDGSIDWATYDAYVDWQLQNGPEGLFAVCGTSEMKWLTLDERLALAKRARARAGGRPVVATANLEGDPAAQRDEVRRMADTGVSGVVLVPPEGMGEDQARLTEHFGALAQAAGIPTFVYEWPQVKPHHVEASAFGRMVKEFGIAGIKDTTCTREGIAAKIAAAPEAIVYQANTPYLLDTLQTGAKGIMAIVSSCSSLPERLWALRDRLNGEAAQTVHAGLVFLDAVLRMGYPAAGKYVVNASGCPFPPATRWPVRLAPEATRALDAFVQFAARLG